MEIGTMSKLKKTMVAAVSVLFVVLSVWQVQARREDWPLSKYDMYSLQQGAYAQRKVLYGVSKDGEFPLLSVGYRLPSKFWFQFSSIERQQRKVRKLLAKVEKDYTARRESERGLPKLTGIKVYRQSWKIEPRMRGSEAAKQKLLFHYKKSDDSPQRKQKPRKRARSGVSSGASRP